MKRSAVALAILLPVAWLLVLVIRPAWDGMVHVPELHFYVVTFFTFVAVVVTMLVAFALGESSLPRHRLLATAFAAMGAVFFIHGVKTPGALTLAPNPGVRWAAWLTLFVGGLLFALATSDRPGRPLSRRSFLAINWGFLAFYLLFVGAVFFAPELLTLVDEQAGPFHTELVFWLTLLAWVFAGIRFELTWRRTADHVDGVMALIAAWLAMGTVSLHRFPLWHLSWWTYHVLLLAGALLALWALAGRYEQLRRFRLSWYYVTVGLVVTGALTLLAGHVMSRLVAGEWLAMGDMATAVVQARLVGLVVAGLSMGGLFAGLYIVVHRADRLITARTEELAQAYADLQAAEAMRDDLTGMIVHDLRTPLTAIDLSTSMLAESLLDSSKVAYRQKFINNTRTSVQRMLALIGQLLDITKLEAGQLVPRKEPLAVVELLERRAAAFTAQAEAQRIALQVSLNGRRPVAAADGELVSRVLDNLIGNALKYTEAGGQVCLQANGNGRVVLVQVQDSGEGIPAAELETIFDKYAQVVGETGQARRPGTGLGLHFCRLAVEAHGGRIWAESRPGAGSTFSFTLPADPAGIPT
jgi:signal transduction histidine kinase